MRHLKLSSSGLPFGHPISSGRGKTQEQLALVNEDCNNSFANPATYSQRTRSMVMSKNYQDALEFINSQDTALKSAIACLESFLSEIDTKNGSRARKCQYFLQAGMLQSTIYARYRGKPLFDNMRDKPLRIHIEVDGLLAPIDLPNPQLSCSPALQGFICGAESGCLPSRKLLFECISCLVDARELIREQRDKLSSCWSDHLSKAAKYKRRTFVVSSNHTHRLHSGLHELIWSHLCKWASMLGGQWVKPFNA